MLFKGMTVLIRGGGELGSGVAHRLFRCGFPVVIVEQPNPTAIRRAVCFSEAVYDGWKEVEGVVSELVHSADEALHRHRRREAIPVLVDPAGGSIRKIRPEVLVDARMLKSHLDAGWEHIPLVIGLGPGFVAGENCDVVVETVRGNNLGRVIERGGPAVDTGIPEKIGGYGRERMVRAPARGRFSPTRRIGDLVKEGEIIGEIGGEAVSVEIAGLLRGAIRKGIEAEKGMKIADIDPRGSTVDHRHISDKARAVAGGVLEAILSFISNDSFISNSQESTR